MSIHVPALLRRAGVLAALLALAGCERTVFESPPSDRTRCDKALVGDWLSEGDRHSDTGELRASVAADCTLRVTEQRAGGPRESGPVTLHSDRLGGQPYLWLDADWAHRSFDVEPGPLAQAGDVYLFAYGTTGRDGLTLYSPRHRALAHRVLDKDVRGEVLAQDDALTVRIPGDTESTAALLRKYRLFDTANGIRFRRATPTPR